MNMIFIKKNTYKKINNKTIDEYIPIWFKFHDVFFSLRFIMHIFDKAWHIYEGFRFCAHRIHTRQRLGEKRFSEKKNRFSPHFHHSDFYHPKSGQNPPKTLLKKKKTAARSGKCDTLRQPCCRRVKAATALSSLLPFGRLWPCDQRTPTIGTFIPFSIYRFDASNRCVV